MKNLGQIKVGQAADIVLYNIEEPRMAGVHSPLFAPLLCGEPVNIEMSFVQGKRIYDGTEQDLFDTDKFVADIKQGLQSLIAKCT